LRSFAVIEKDEKDEASIDSQDPQLVPKNLEINADSNELPKVGGWDENVGKQDDFYIDGDYLYTMGLYTGITKFDISQKDDPILLGSYRDEEYFNGEFFVKNDTAFIKDLFGEFKILNVSNINQVEELSSINVTFTYDLVEIAEDILLLGNSDEEIFLFDISNLHSPTLIHTLNLSSTTTDIQDLAVKDNILFIIDDLGDYIFYNLTDPMLPGLIGTFDNPIEGDNDNIQFNENYLYTRQGYHRISFINITEIYNPNYITSINLTGNSLKDCIISDNVLYAMNTTFLIYNVTEITNPVYVSTYSEIYIGLNIRATADYVFVIDFSNKLKILDIVDGINPQLIASFNFGDQTADISCEGNLAAIANYVDGVLIFDITNKSQPKKLSQIDNLYASKVILHNNFLYVIRSQRYIEIYDITDTENPILTSSYNGSTIWHKYYDFILDGDYLILMIFQGGIEVINISDPSSPTHVSEHLEGFFTSRDMVLDKHILYLLGYGPPGDILIFDVSDYQNIVLDKILSITNIEGGRICVEENVLFMLGYSLLTDQDYLYYYNIKRNGDYPLGGYYVIGVDEYYTDLLVSGNFIYLSSFIHGVVVFRKSSFNVFEPFVPFTNNETGFSLFLYEDYLYLAAGFDGFVIYQAFENAPDYQIIIVIASVVGGLAIFIVAAILFFRYRLRKEIGRSREQENSKDRYYK